MLVLTLKIKPFKYSIYILSLLFLTFFFSSSAQAEITIKDSQGDVFFETQPVRVVALSWELIENVLELGVIPIAAPEIENYKEWVAKPQIPNSTVEIGNRAEPNLERLMQLKPDVILISDTLKSMQSRLERIAPVVFFDTYRADHNNAEQADWVFLSIAKLLNKTALAKQKLNQREETFKSLSVSLNKAFPNGLPAVASLRFANTTSAYVYGDNSMPQYALEKLGIKPALALPATQWGVTQQRLKQLRQIDHGSVLYFHPFYQEDKLKQSRLWQAMPFVQQNQTAPVSSTWTYGGAMSLQYLAESLTDSLLTIAP